MFVFEMEKEIRDKKVRFCEKNLFCKKCRDFASVSFFEIFLIYLINFHFPPELAPTYFQHAGGFLLASLSHLQGGNDGLPFQDLQGGHGLSGIGPGGFQGNFQFPAQPSRLQTGQVPLGDDGALGKDETIL
jgi:hypothetical protein